MNESANPFNPSASQPVDPTVLRLTDSAAQKVRRLREEEGDSDLMLRVYVTGGGCSGFQYAFDVTTTADSDDLRIERDGATVLIDSVSLGFLQGSRIDFVDDLIGQSFKIDNPNATASCGCGTSFSV